MTFLVTVPPILAAFCFLIGCLFFRFGKGEKKPSVLQLFLPLFAALAQILLLLLIWTVQHFWTNGTYDAVPLAAVLLFCIVTDAAVLFHVWGKSDKLRRLLRRFGILAAALLVVEAFLFNAKSLTFHPQQEVIPAEELQLKDYRISEREDDHILVFSDSVIIAEDLPDWTRCLTIQAEQSPDQSPIRIKCLMTDNNFLHAPQIFGHKLTSTYGKDVAFAVLPYQKLRMVRVEFFDICAPVSLYSFTCMNKMPYSFSLWRYFGLFLLLAGILLLRSYHLTAVTYDRTKRRHRLAMGAMTLLCVASVVIFRIPNQHPFVYPDEFVIENANPYEQTFDAFQSGHAWINIPVDEQLEDLEFVFDRMDRDESGIPYLFDHALYGGKYYSYFGIAPVVTFYYPFYWLTGKLPTMAMVCMFYSPFTILLMCLTVLTAVRLCCKKPNFLLLFLSLPVCTALCGAYYALEFPSQYDVVVASGLCFLLLALWSGMQACLVQKKWLRYVLFAVCAIGCVFCVQSRPSMALTTVILAPFFIGVLRDKSFTLKERIFQAASFGVPLVIGAGATMYYNAIRFESPLDFGAGYQLTISNIQANQMRLSALPAAIYHYLIQPLTARPYFPFFTISYYALDNYHMYNNLEHTAGAFVFPSLILALLLVPKAVRSRHAIGGAATAKQSKWMLLCAGIMTLLIVWLDFCMGGVSLRYSIDFLPILVLSATVILLGTVRDPKRYVYFLAVISLLATLLMAWLLMAQVYTEGSVETTLTFWHPTLHEELAEAFLFWE